MSGSRGSRSEFTTRAAERVDKPWGYEEIFGVLEGRYAGKALHVDAGESLSLQFHRTKHETVSVLSGRIVLEVGWHDDALERFTLGPGESFDVPAGLLHRITAVDDAVLVEASTADPGWREDVVRLEDRYGRVGATTP